MTRTAVGLAAAAAGLLVGFWGGWQVHDAWRDLSPRHREAAEDAAPQGSVAQNPAPIIVEPGPAAGRAVDPPPDAREPRASAPGDTPVIAALPPGAGRVDPAPPPASEGPIVTADEALRDLRARKLIVPVSGIEASNLVPSFDQPRGTDRRHEAIDIMAPRGTAVLAVEDGTVARLFTSEFGGLTIYQFDPSSRYAYYYAHLDRYAAGLAEGQRVRRGQLIGYVGSTGNASPSAPHLHFGIFLLTPERRWWQGSPLDPYAVWR